MPGKIAAAEYIRGAAMLGVVGIHAGAYSLAGPAVNVHLFALLEIFTRFSVPIFFFVSAFGLFYQYRPGAPFGYGRFFRRRAAAVLVPYLAWSLLYMAHNSWATGDVWPWEPPHLYEFLLFGLASYHLYFLVILMWFYALMPLWRAVVPPLAARPLPWLGALMSAQVWFNYWSCNVLPFGAEDYYADLALKHRLSYWVLHYVFVFLLGAVCAVRLEDFRSFAARRRRELGMFFAIALAAMLGRYYWLLGNGKDPEQAVNTVQQLSPEGVVYTLAVCLALFAVFDRPLSPALSYPLSLLARHSYAVYLAHPLVMFHLAAGLAAAGEALTPPVVAGFYAATVGVSLLFAAGLERLPAFGPLLTGSAPSKVKPGT
ncbi:acyltransferase [Anaeroselena agilis]|uniref:Acyltransferase n=1 Tax=Anaeroselena agilis TaxID=3063788 RepID=A0ABU3NWV6_9FIRM|nr:acyltransferase [Selenomonadales bacterium 4137-cl]